MLVRQIFIIAVLLSWPLSLILANKIPTRFPETIFYISQASIDEVIVQTSAYPSLSIARVFHNKPLIILRSYENNLTALLDPNNYFFGFHPREMLSGYINNIKFPFVTIPIFIYGIFIQRDKRSIDNLKLLAVFILLLAFLKVFEPYDFIIYFPLSKIFINSLKVMYSKFKWMSAYVIISIPISVIELIRQIYIYQLK